MSHETKFCAGEPPLALLTHPWVLAAVAITAVNDHLFKGAGWLPDVLTGKLSDVSGLFFFPIVLAVVLSLLARRLDSTAGHAADLRGLAPRVWIDGAVVLTVMGFSSVNILEPVNVLAERYWGVFTMDPTDLLCLPMVVLARQFMTNRWSVSVASASNRTAAAFRWKPWLGLLLAATVTVATSRPATIDVSNFPAWHLSEPGVERVDRVEVRAWFAKTGEEGAGLVLKLDTIDGQEVRVEVDRATLRLEDGPTIELRRSPAYSFDDHQSLYLVFEFDNEAAWNDGRRQATLTLDLRVNDVREKLQYAAEFASRSPTSTYTKYRHWKGAEPIRADAVAEDSGENGTWGPDPDNPGLERTGPSGHCRAEYLRRDPDRPEQIRVRFPYDPADCKEVEDE
ncbi:MAG: hypothetical protein ACQEVA_04260 [Myxococcota bacterium]